MASGSVSRSCGSCCVKLAIPWLALLLAACGRPAADAKPELHVAAAANLSNVFAQLAAPYEKRTGVRLIPSFGSTAQLTQQIENGAPFDLFLAADTEHVDRLVQEGRASSRAIYARGQLVLWAPKRLDIVSLRDLARPDVKAIVIAKPELAPYGRASVEALKSLRLWDAVQAKIVYAQSISAAKQYADTGNGDAAFTALALTLATPGHSISIPVNLHAPIEQGMCLVKDSAPARAFEQFVLGPEGAAILVQRGYLKP